MTARTTGTAPSATSATSARARRTPHTRPGKKPGPAGVRRLLLGRTAAALATALIPTTLTLAVVHAGSSSGALGAILASEFVPMLLLLPVAGVFADRFPARRVILLADLTRAAAQAGIGVSLLTDGVNVPVLSALAAVTGGAVAFGTPAVRTLVSATLSGPLRQQLNARLSAWQGLAQFAGPGIAGSLMLGIGAGWSSLLTAALFTGSALTLGGLGTPAAPTPPSASSAPAPAAATAPTAATASRRAPFLQDLRAGWTETRRHPWFIANVLGHGIWNMTAGVLLTLGPVITIGHLGGGTAWVTTLQSGTVGMLAGVWTAGRLHLKRPLIAVALGASAYALPLAALAVTAPLPLLIAAYTAGMFGLGILDPLWETTVQQRIPRETLGRVGSFDTLISFAARPLGLALAAPLAAAVGRTVPLAVSALLVGGANLAVLAIPAVREHPEPHCQCPDAESPLSPPQRPEDSAMPLSNPLMADYQFLAVLYADDFFPDHVLDKGKAILVRLCERLEAEPPADLAALYALTQAAAGEFNDLEAEFEAAGSEIETVAREEICGDLYNVAVAYGFGNADHEQLAGTRNW